MEIDELLIKFDEMGFAPATLCENPDEYACEWKKQLVAEIEKLKIQLAQANAGIVNCSGCRLVEINAVKEFAERLKEKLLNFIEDNEDYDGKVSSGTLYVDVIGIIGKNGEVISLGLIDKLLKEYEK